MDIQIYGVSALAIIIGLVGVIKQLGMPAKWAAPVAILVGVLIMLARIFVPAVYLEAIVVGAALGLMAVGAYAVGGKSTEKNQ